MFGIRENDEIRREAFRLHRDQSNAKVRVPAPFRRRSGIEQRCLPHAIEQRLMTVPEQHAIDLADPSPDGLITRRPTTMTVDHAEGELPDAEPGCMREND